MEALLYQNNLFLHNYFVEIKFNKGVNRALFQNTIITLPLLFSLSQLNIDWDQPKQEVYHLYHAMPHQMIAPLKSRNQPSLSFVPPRFLVPVAVVYRSLPHSKPSP